MHMVMLKKQSPALESALQNSFSMDTRCGLSCDIREHIGVWGIAAWKLVQYMGVRPSPCVVMHVGKYLCDSSYKEVQQLHQWLETELENHGNDEWVEPGDRDSCGVVGLFLLYTVEKKCFRDKPGYLKELTPTLWGAPWVAVKCLWSWISEVPLPDLWQVTSLVLSAELVLFMNGTNLKGICED